MNDYDEHNYTFSILAREKIKSSAPKKVEVGVVSGHNPVALAISF